jgi:hypothetical protein
MPLVDASTPKNITKVVVTNHKTGTQLMQAILREYCAKYRLRLLQLDQHLKSNKGRIDPAIDFQGYDFIFVTHAQHFEKLVDAVPNLSYKAVHLIRNPYEIVMSGVRYHQVTDEAWCNSKRFVADEKENGGFRKIAPHEKGEYSYREIMNALPYAGKIAFEIRQQAMPSGTIVCIEHFLKRFRHHDNVTSIRLEDIGAAECVTHVFKFLDLNEEFADHYRSKVGSKKWLRGHITNPDVKDTYESAFNEELYDLFASAFGSSILRDFGYSADSPLPEYFALYAETQQQVRGSSVL